MVTSYLEREIEIEDAEVVPLVDFIAANLGRLSEAIILELESLRVGDVAQVGKMTIRRVK